VSLKGKQTVSKEDFMWESRDGFMGCCRLFEQKWKHKGLGFFRIPKIIANQGKESEELTTRKISAVSHGDATNKRVLESDTSSSESQHSNCRPWKEEICRKTTKMQPKEL